MPRKPGAITSIERQLGLYTQYGLQRTKRTDLPAPLQQLLQAIEDIKIRYQDFSPSRLREVQQFGHDCEALSAAFGPLLYPYDPASTPVRKTIEEPYYPHDLVYDLRDDRTKLHSLFRELLSAQCNTNYYNRLQKLKRNPDLQSTSSSQRSSTEQTADQLEALTAEPVNTTPIEFSASREPSPSRHIIPGTNNADPILSISIRARPSGAATEDSACIGARRALDLCLESEGRQSALPLLQPESPVGAQAPQNRAEDSLQAIQPISTHHAEQFPRERSMALAPTTIVETEYVAGTTSQRRPGSPLEQEVPSKRRLLPCPADSDTINVTTARHVRDRPDIQRHSQPSPATIEQTQQATAMQDTAEFHRRTSSMGFEDRTAENTPRPPRKRLTIVDWGVDTAEPMIFSASKRCKTSMGLGQLLRESIPSECRDKQITRAKVAVDRMQPKDFIERHGCCIDFEQNEAFDLWMKADEDDDSYEETYWKMTVVYKDELGVSGGEH